jgi:hypothetical protein
MSKPCRDITSLLLATLLLGSGLAARTADRVKFGLAALRRDGLMIPFAFYEGGGSWRNSWPETDINVDIPMSLADVPKKWWGPIDAATPWTAWLFGDGALTPRPLKIQKPEQHSIFCGGHVVLQTDYKGADVDERAPTVPKDGLAIGAAPGTVTLQPVTQVSVLSPDAAALVAAITGDFNKAEDAAAERFTGWKHPFSASQRQALPIEIETFDRGREQTKRGSWLTTYVEAVRRYPPREGDKGCGLITYANGWVLEGEGKPQIFLSARVTYCDREGVEFMLPFGRITVDDEVYWVYQFSGWRDEQFGVSRVRPDEVRNVGRTFGGACPRDPIRIR